MREAPGSPTNQNCALARRGRRRGHIKTYPGYLLFRRPFSSHPEYPNSGQARFRERDFDRHAFRVVSPPKISLAPRHREAKNDLLGISGPIARKFESGKNLVTHSVRPHRDDGDRDGGRTWGRRWSGRGSRWRVCHRARIFAPRGEGGCQNQKQGGN